MKKLVLLLTAITIAACQEEEHYNPHSIQGSWYGKVGEQYLTKEDQIIRLNLTNKSASISCYFASWATCDGWHDLEGSYSIGSDYILRFNFEYPECKKAYCAKDIKITHAELAYSDLSGDLLKLHYTENGEEHWIWLDRNKE